MLPTTKTVVNPIVRSVAIVQEFDKRWPFSIQGGHIKNASNNGVVIGLVAELFNVHLLPEILQMTTALVRICERKLRYDAAYRRLTYQDIRPFELWRNGSAISGLED